MPTKTLPANPSLDHLKNQVKDLVNARRVMDLSACQRIREFHPLFHQATDTEIAGTKFLLADARLTVAREYGFASWTRLKTFVEKNEKSSKDVPLQERIQDPEFREAVRLIDEGDEAGLRRLLSLHPDLVSRKVTFEGLNYFRSPSLLEFCSENPVRNDRLPPNIVLIAQLILECGASVGSANSTLATVASGRVARECGVQNGLIELLCRFGAKADDAMQVALVHEEFEAARILLRMGATLTFSTAIALDRMTEAVALFPSAGPHERHVALALGAMFGRTEGVRLLLAAGEDPNRFNPVGTHSHSTPLHNAALNGHADTVRLLLDYGADPEIKDILWQGTSLGWAKHGGQMEIVEVLEAWKSPESLA